MTEAENLRKDTERNWRSMAGTSLPIPASFSV